MARAPKDDAVALAALRRWMRQRPSAALIMGYCESEDGGDTVRSEFAMVDAEAWDLVDMASAILERAYEKFDAMVDFPQRLQALQEISAAMAAIGDRQTRADN